MTIQTNGDDCRESGAGETSREQFEAWTKMFGGKPDLKRANGGANYADSFIDIAWLAWKASRAAIEISMPPRVITAEIGPAVSLEKIRTSSIAREDDGATRCYWNQGETT